MITAKNDKITSIVLAPLFKRVIAGVIDAIIVIFIAGGLYAAGGEIAKRISYIKDYHTQYNALALESGLLTYNQNDDSYNPYVYDSIEDYQNLFYRFYHDFYQEKAEDNITYDIYWFNVHVYGQEDKKQLYKNENLDEQSYLRFYGQSLFTYQLDTHGEPILDSFAIPKCYKNSIDNKNAISSIDKDELLAYFYKSDEARNSIDSSSLWRNYVYYYALKDFSNLSVVTNLESNYLFYSMTLPLLSALLLSTIIFVVILPFIFKNGETLGKRIMGICLINSLGYQILKKQLVIRQLFFVLVICVFVFIFGLNIITMGLFTLIALASFIMMIFNKKHLAIHDFLAATLVIDKKASSWFLNANEESKAQNELDNINSVISVNQKQNN